MRLTWSRHGDRLLGKVDGVIRAAIEPGVSDTGSRGYYWHGWGVSAGDVLHSNTRDARCAARSYFTANHNKRTA